MKLAKAEALPVEHRRGPGRPKKILDHAKLESIVEVLPASPEERLETLLIFDARCLDMETRRALLRLLPELVHIRHAWKAEYMECGCVSCHKKRPDYGAGGFCSACQFRILHRMQKRRRDALNGAEAIATYRDQKSRNNPQRTVVRRHPLQHADFLKM